MSQWWRQRTFKLNKQKWAFEKGAWQPVLREEHVLREIVTRLWLEGRIKVWRVRERIPGTGHAPSTPGIPDLIGYLPRAAAGSATGASTSGPGTFAVPLFIEVKRPGAVRRPAQEQFIAEARSAGCVAFFGESWDDVVRELGIFGIKLKQEAA